jgi:hypothetical protein
MTEQGWIVVTSINPPTPAVEAIARLCRGGWSAVVVGDLATPPDWHCAGVTYLGVEAQRRQFGPLADAIPYRHYCRKNLGYLYALRQGARVVLETDDDNIPYDTFGVGVRQSVAGRPLTGPGWVNVYRHFTRQAVWPRGLPLDAVHAAGTLGDPAGPRDCPVQQYLADNDPDVDAIYRLTQGGTVFFDDRADTVVLDRDTWCPFNSQNTVFFPEAFPLLYLPCHVSFRVTDIWRSFVAQAALAHHGYALAFHPPTVEQVRNAHDLMRDFADEVEGYLHNRAIMEVLTRTLPTRRPQGTGLAATASLLWCSLADAGFIPERELPLLEAWFENFQKPLALAS